MDKYNLLDKFNQDISNKYELLKNEILQLGSYQLYGSIVSAVGTTIEAYLPNVKIGDLCQILDKSNGVELLAEVVAVTPQKVRLLPFGNISNLSQNCLIKVISDGFKIEVGDFLLGKVVDGFGNIITDIKQTESKETKTDAIKQRRAIQSLAPHPFERPLITEPLVTGVKAIDLFNTCGLGQRVGIFAGPGVGKTTLMGMIIRNSKVDVVVVALIGERGREVREFIEIELANYDIDNCILVVATSDRPPVEQLKCAYVAQTIAEYFRDQGKNVLLFVDSITRFARAGREVGLSSGEPITRGGYPPSVFLSFPKLMERAGCNLHGSISAFYTVLMEGENISDDAIADEVKSIIDGHIVLSRKLAEKSQFPAVDVLKSLSRIADRIIDDNHLSAVRKLRLLLAKRDEIEFLLQVGEYKAGSDRLADESIAKIDQIIKLLKQNQNDNIDYESAIAQLIKLAH